MYSLQFKIESFLLLHLPKRKWNYTMKLRIITLVQIYI
jgi:hypothetical protein